MTGLMNATSSNPFDTAKILDGIRQWVEIETPTEVPAQVNKLADVVAQGYRDLPVTLERIAGRDGGKIVTGRKGVARFEIFVKGVPAHAGTRPQDGRSAIRELGNIIQTLEAMNDFRRGVSVNVGVVNGGTKPNVIAEEAYAEVDMRVPTIADSDELVPKILNLKSRTEGVSVKVIGELNRPPYEKGNAGAALYEHAKTLAAEIGFDLVDTATGGGSDGNFTAPHTATLDGLGVDGQGAHTHYEQMYISSIEPRARLLHRLYQTLR